MNSVAARYFVACVHKGGTLRASMDKAALAIQSRSKLLSLDYPWIEANKKVLSVIRIDCDRVFDSLGQCAAELREIVGLRVPCMPHLITGDLLPDGRYSRPHFYFLLPVGHGVWNDPTDVRCRMDIVRMFHAVSLGLVAALLEIGADPCAPALTMRGKNPLSPYWHTICPNDHIWPTLSDYAGWVDMSASRERLVRKASALQTGRGIGANELFTAVQKQAFAILRQWHFDADPRGKGERGRIADELHQQLVPFLAEIGCHHLSEAQTDLLVAKVSDYAAGAWDASKVETVRKVRGRLLHVTEGIVAVSKKQAAGAAFAAGVKAERSLAALVEACIALRDDGRPVTQTAAALLAGVHRRTAVRRWAEVSEVVATFRSCDNRCIDKKEAPTPAMLRPMSTADEREAGAGIEASMGAGRESESIRTNEQPGTAMHLAVIEHNVIETDRGDVCEMPSGAACMALDQTRWHSDHHNDDIAEIEAQEAWLSSHESVPSSAHLEPDEEWFGERRQAA